MSAVKNFTQAEEYLYRFINLEKGQTPYTKREYRLDRMEKFLALAGNPHHDAATVHIAGSKGKGSTAMFLASILEAHGYRTGLYTSPHVLHIRERIQINRKPVSKAFFTRLVRRVERILHAHAPEQFPGGMHPTFFEIMTLMAFCAFREKKCRFWVIETGLGGRLDATNVIRPRAVILTPIELEHEDILGDTIEKIAAEKCGIIKEHVPVFSAEQRPEVREVITRFVAEKKTTVEHLGKIAGKLTSQVTTVGTKMELVFRDPDETFDSGTEKRYGKDRAAESTGAAISVKLSMLGAHQAENAALAVAAAFSVLPAVSKASVKKGLAQARLPGRMEVLKRKPLVMADGAHTPESIRTVIKTAEAVCGRPRILVYACVSGKKFREMADLLAPCFDHVIISTPGLFRKSDPEEVFRYFSLIHKAVEFCEKPANALKQAYKVSGSFSRVRVNAPIIVTGSFYFVSEIRKLFPVH